jgi:hypothetical protein
MHQDARSDSPVPGVPKRASIKEDAAEASDETPATSPQPDKSPLLTAQPIAITEDMDDVSLDEGQYSCFIPHPRRGHAQAPASSFRNIHMGKHSRQAYRRELDDL